MDLDYRVGLWRRVIWSAVRVRVRVRSGMIVSLAKNVYACAATKIKRSISGKVIGLEAKSPRNVVKMKEEMAAFFASGCVVVLLPL